MIVAVDFVAHVEGRTVNTEKSHVIKRSARQTALTWRSSILSREYLQPRWRVRLEPWHRTPMLSFWNVVLVDRRAKSTTSASVDHVDSTYRRWSRSGCVRELFTSQTSSNFDCARIRRAEIRIESSVDRHG